MGGGISAAAMARSSSLTLFLSSHSLTVWMREMTSSAVTLPRWGVGFRAGLRDRAA